MIPIKSSPQRKLEREGVLFSRSFNSRKLKRPCFHIIHNKKTSFQYQSLYIVFGNCRGTGGILWLFPSIVERWIFWNHSIRGPNSPPEKHLKCHDKMAGNISVTRFHLLVQDGGLVTFDKFAFHMYFYCIPVLSLNEDSSPPEIILHVK